MLAHFFSTTSDSRFLFDRFCFEPTTFDMKSEYLQNLSARREGTGERDVVRVKDAFLEALEDGIICSGNDVSDSTDRGNVLQVYFRGMLNMAAVGDNSGHWVCYAVDGVLCDEHLMQTGLSAMDLPRSVVSTPVTFGQGVLNYTRKRSMERIQDDADKTSPELYANMLAFVRNHVRKGQTRRIFTVLCHVAHWGMIAVTILENASITVEWGDSLLGGAPGGVLETVKQVMGDVMGTVNVQVSKGNLMKELGF